MSSFLKKVSIYANVKISSNVRNKKEFENLGCDQFQDKSIFENVPPNNNLKVVQEKGSNSIEQASKNSTRKERQKIRQR